MAALSSIALGVGAVFAGASYVNQKRQQKKQAAEARRIARENERKAKEAARLRGTKQNDPRVKIGAADQTTSTDTSGDNKGRGTRKSATGISQSSAFSGASSNIGGLL